MIDSEPRWRGNFGWNSASTLLLVGWVALLASCASAPRREVVVSVRDQRIALMESGSAVRVYRCSTSKFGVGDRPGTYATPLGTLAIATKIGGGAAPGAVFKSRRPTGEVLPANAPGRDPIVTRIMWLRGLQSQNRKAFGRCIYIHGTPEERTIGHPASYGCIRMCSQDVIDLFDRVEVGVPVRIRQGALPGDARRLARAIERTPVRQPASPVPGETAAAMIAHQTATPHSINGRRMN